MKKVVKYLIIVLVPLVAAFLMGLYGYNYYQGGVAAKESYYSEAEENASSQLQYFMQYNEYKYEKTPVVSQEVKDSEGNTLMKFEIYRASFMGIKTVNKQDVDWEYARYIFFAYDVDYVGIKDLFDFESTSSKKDAATPTISVVLTPNDTTEFDPEEDAYKIALTTSSKSIDGYFGIVDYNATPLKDDPDPYISSSHIGAIYTRWDIENMYSEEFGTDFTMTLEATTTLYSETLTLDNPLAEVNYDFDDKFADFKDTSFNVGFNGNEIAAGYFSWVFGAYLWWICLIAFVVVGFLTYMFVAIWEADGGPKKTPHSNSKKLKK